MLSYNVPNILQTPSSLKTKTKTNQQNKKTHRYFSPDHIIAILKRNISSARNVTLEFPLQIRNAGINKNQPNKHQK